MYKDIIWEIYATFSIVLILAVAAAWVDLILMAWYYVAFSFMGVY